MPGRHHKGGIHQINTVRLQWGLFSIASQPLQCVLHEVTDFAKWLPIRQKGQFQVVQFRLEVTREQSLKAFLVKVRTVDSLDDMEAENA